MPNSFSANAFKKIIACNRQCQSLIGDAGPVTGGGGLRVSKMGKLQDKGKLGKLGISFHVQVCI